MKKFLKGMVIAVLVVSLVPLAFGACKKEEKKETPPAGGIHDQTYVQDTEYVLVEKGASDYKIVIAENADKNETFAAEELQYFMELATGCKLEIIRDANLAFSDESKFLSIGQNRLFAQAGLTADNALLARSGYQVKTVGQSVFMYGSNWLYNNFGVVYSVYGYLEQQIGLKIYTQDHFTYDSTYLLRLKQCDVTEKPDFDWRRYGVKAVGDSEMYCLRMRLSPNTEVVSGTTGHSHFEYLPIEKYQSDHPDWYTEDGAQLCLSADATGMFDEFIENVKQKLIDDPRATIVHLGLRDINNSTCKCERCQKKMEKYGTTQSGLNIMFVNAVSSAVSAWLEKEYPGRVVSYRTLAYFEHTEAPVNYDRETDTFTPHHEMTIPNENVQIMIAPIGMSDYSVPMTDEVNNHIYSTLRGWAAVSDNISFWNYGQNFRGYMINFNNFGSLKANLTTMLEYGTTGFYEQCALGSNTAGFQELRVWLTAQLAWNVDQDYETLVKEFIDTYYGPAAPQIFEYFRLTVANNLNMRQYNKAPQTIYASAQLSRDNWPLELVMRMDRLFTDALAAIDGSDLPELEKIQYTDRVNWQKMTVLTFKIELYYTLFTREAVDDMIDEIQMLAQKNGVTSFWESNYTMLTKLDEWRAANNNR